jgi:hypothetical protein
MPPRRPEHRLVKKIGRVGESGPRTIGIAPRSGSYHLLGDNKLYSHGKDVAVPPEMVISVPHGSNQTGGDNSMSEQN